MRWSLRVDIFEGVRVLVFVNLPGRNLAGNDAAEQAVFHVVSNPEMAEFRPFLLPFAVKSLWTAKFAKLAQSSQSSSQNPDYNLPTRSLHLPTRRQSWDLKLWSNARNLAKKRKSFPKCTWSRAIPFLLRKGGNHWPKLK
jgi:hypothetical protein